MLQVSYGKEVETLRQNLLVQGQKLEAAQQRVSELETHLSKKEHLIVEQKKFLEDVKCQGRWAWTYKSLKWAWIGTSESQGHESMVWPDQNAWCIFFLSVYFTFSHNRFPTLSFSLSPSCLNSLFAGRSCRPQTAGITLRGESHSCCRRSSCSSTAEWRWRLLPALPPVHQQGAELTRTLVLTPGQTWSTIRVQRISFVLFSGCLFHRYSSWQIGKTQRLEKSQKKM